MPAERNSEGIDLNMRGDEALSVRERGMLISGRAGDCCAATWMLRLVGFWSTVENLCGWYVAGHITSKCGSLGFGDDVCPGRLAFYAVEYIYG